MQDTTRSSPPERREENFSLTSPLIGLIEIYLHPIFRINPRKRPRVPDSVNAWIVAHGEIGGIWPESLNSTIV